MNFKHFVIPLLLLFLFASCTDDTLDADFNDNSLEQSPESYRSKRSCGHEKHMEKLLSNPEYKSQHEEKFNKLQIELSKAQVRNCNDPVIIPVAVHFQNVTGTNASCLAQLVESQISVLNKDIAGTNTDISKWTTQAASFFPGISNGETCVKFCVATKNHPSGYSLTNGQPAITVNKTNGDQLNAWSGYLNIFVRPNLGFLGEAPLGGSGNGDGVLIDASTFGLGAGCGNVRPQSPYNLGRTTTHEVGHYLLLDHIWGNGCGVDDDVADTPDQASDSGGCPNLGVKSCGSNDMHMNYMDYTDDSCMYMFSSGQSQRMLAYVNSNLTNMINKASSVCSESTGGGDNGGGDTGGGDTGGGDTGGGDTGGGDTGGNSECSAVSSSSVQVLSSTSVRVNWTDVNDAVLYRLRYRKLGTSSWTGKNVTASQFTISSLSANTTYQYQVKVRCPFGWTRISDIDVFTTESEGDTGGGDTGGNGSCNGNEISFKLILDDYGSETSWELVKENGSQVASGGPFEDGQRGKQIKENFCLADGCYIMYVDDSYGDGICCDYGRGKIVIKDSEGEDIRRSNGKFGSYIKLNFCVSDGLARFVGEVKDEPKENLGRKIKIN